MNEHIEELWEQCKTSDWSYDNQTYDHKKFAELIVKECAKTCADVGMQSGGGCTIVGETYLDASKRIRATFGIDTFNLY